MAALLVEGDDPRTDGAGLLPRVSCSSSSNAAATRATGGALPMRWVMRPGRAAAQRENIGPGAQLIASDQHVVA